MQILTFNLKLFTFLLLFWLLRVVTSGGLGMILELLISGYFYLGIFFFSLILSLIIFIKIKRFIPIQEMKVEIPKKLSFFILALSVFLIIFNDGACGSDRYDPSAFRGMVSNQPGNFIQRIITKESCLDTTRDWISSNILFLGLILNFILIITLILFSLFSVLKSIDAKK